MPYYRRRVPDLLQAWQWFPGVKLDGIEERTVTHSHLSSIPRVVGYFTNRYGREYPISPGDYVYKDGEHWDACAHQLFESQYEEVP